MCVTKCSQTHALDRSQNVVILSTTCVCYKTFTNILDRSQSIVLMPTSSVCYKTFTNTLYRSQNLFGKLVIDNPSGCLLRDWRENWGGQLVEGPVLESVWHQMPRLIPIHACHSTCLEGKYPQWFHPPQPFHTGLMAELHAQWREGLLVDCI